MERSCQWWKPAAKGVGIGVCGPLAFELTGSACVEVVARPARHGSGFHIRDMPMAQIDDVAPFARTGSTFITRALSVAGGP